MTDLLLIAEPLAKLAYEDLSLRLKLAGIGDGLSQKFLETCLLPKLKLPEVYQEQQRRSRLL